MTKSDWICYLIESEAYHTYIGASNNAIKRLRTHNRGKGAKRTKGQQWSHVLIVSGFKSKHECLSFESGWKKLAKKRSKKLFDSFDDDSGIDLRYTDYQSWNRILDLLHFFNSFNYRGTKFIMRKDCVGQSKPDELCIEVFGHMKDLDIIDDIPWPSFVKLIK